MLTIDKWRDVSDAHEVHDTTSNMGKSTQTGSIRLEWADLAQKFNQPTVICMEAITWTTWCDNC